MTFLIQFFMHFSAHALLPVQNEFQPAQYGPSYVVRSEVESQKVAVDSHVESNEGTLVAANSAPVVGREAAARYLRKPAKEIPQDDGVMWLHVGRAAGSQAYNWKENGRVDGVATNTYGLSYLFSDWNSFDLALRADFNEYDLTGTRAMKMSLLPILMFPQAASRFPIYFGIGVGVGIFFQQIENKSSLSADYQLLAGLRFLDLSPGLGLFLEYTMKNHVHLLSEGQLNSSVISLGPIFTF